MFGTDSLHLRDETNVLLKKIELLTFFQKKTLPPVMHPEIVSGMGIAKKCPFGAESSLSSIDIMQFLFEQVIE